MRKASVALLLITSTVAALIYLRQPPNGTAVELDTKLPWRGVVQSLSVSDTGDRILTGTFNKGVAILGTSDLQLIQSRKVRSFAATLSPNGNVFAVGTLEGKDQKGTQLIDFSNDGG
jgi:hypothetical protein